MTKFVMRSRFTGKVNSMDIPGPAAQIRDWLNADPKKRLHVQYAFPDLSSDEREFLLTGCTPEEWDKIFGGEEEGEEEPSRIPVESF